MKAVQKHLDTYAHLWPDNDDFTRKALEAGLEQIVSPTCHAVAEVEQA